MILGSEELDAREEALIAVTREAGDLARDLFSKPIEVKLKGKQDYITEADGQVERMIVARLKARFPGDAFLGEEGGASGTAGGPLWVIDPIDGTANFAHGIPHFCVSIAFMAGRELALGAIAAPMYGELYRARLGRGAFLNDRAMRVADADIKHAVVELGWSSRRPVRAYTSLVERVLATGATFLRAGSGALGLAYVAAGRTHGYCELHINSWDTLAGLLLVREAGGVATDLAGVEARVDHTSLLAGNPTMHAWLLDVVKSNG